MTRLCAGSQCLGDHLGASHALSRLTGIHVGGVHVFDAAFRPKARLGRHEHPHARFSFILRGSIGELSAEQTIGCERNMLSFHPATLPHRNEMCAEGARALLIELCGDTGSDIAELVRSRTTPFAVSDRCLRDVAVELSRSLRADDPIRSITVEAIALEFLDRALQRLDERAQKPHRNAPAWLDEFAAFVDERLESQFSVADAAARVRVSPRQLVAALRRYRGTTFVAFLRQRRLESAETLLRSTDMPIATIALAAGFADQSHLTRCFRELHGVTPSRFRRQSDTQTENSF